MGKVLYQWQEECLKKWLDHGARGIVQAVTGSGKTQLALCAIDALEQKLGKNVMVKIVVPTNGLMHQWARALREYLSRTEEVRRNASAEDEIAKKENEIIEVRIYSEKEAALFTKKTAPIKHKIGLRGGGRRDSTECRYMIYVINSARYELARQIRKQLEEGDAVFLVADECHHYASGENQLIFEFLDRIPLEGSAYYSLGLSATLPAGEDRRILTAALGPCIYTYGMTEALMMQTICTFDVFHIALTFQEGEQEDYAELSDEMQYCYTQLRRAVPFLEKMGQQERFEEFRRLSGGTDKRIAKLALTYMNLTYKRKSLVCMAVARVSCAVELIRRLGLKDKILIFGERIAQAEELYRILCQHYSGRVGRCHSELGEQANRNVLERFRTGEFRILITCKSMDEGVDIPDATIAIILSGTSARRQRIQRLGRIIRKKEGKKRAALYYLHVQESTEDICYLPEAGESRLFELSYNFEEKNFSNPAYETVICNAMDDMLRSGSNEKLIQEVYRCLDIGRVRGDWMMDSDVIERRIHEAVETQERNYWICMKKIAVYRKT